MDDPRDAEDATRELDGSRMCGRRVKASFFAYLVLFPPSWCHLQGIIIPLFRLMNRLGNFSEDSSSFKLAKKS